MRVIGLVKSVDHVCCRYRLAAFRSFLEEAGHELEPMPWPRTWLGRLSFHRKLRDADLVIVQRRLLPPWELALLRRAAKRLIFDMDDAVFQRDSYARSGLESGSRYRAFRRMVCAADLVVAGNDYLAEQVATEIDAERVRVIPTCVDPSQYRLARHQRARLGVQLVWIGSSSTMKGLEQATPLLDEIGKQCPGIALKLICDRTLSLPTLPVTFRRWSEDHEASDLASADIGISFVPDDSWSRGKCGLKILQYMAAGLPVVANLVGVQAEMVRHGETGFLAETPGEWCDAVARLAADPALRQRMGQESRRVVETEYSVEAGAVRWLTILEQLAEPVQVAV